MTQEIDQKTEVQPEIKEELSIIQQLEEKGEMAKSLPEAPAAQAFSNLVLEQTALEDTSDLFITEKDTFECELEFYNDNGTIFVKGFDEVFDETKKTRKMTFTCKYPSMSDLTTIINAMGNRNITDFKPSDFVLLEFTRLSILIRKWSLIQPFTQIGEINPKIVKAMLAKVQEKIGLQGLV